VILASSPSTAEISLWGLWAAVAVAVGTLLLFAVTALDFRRNVNESLRAQAARIILEGENDGDREFFVVHNMSDLPIRALAGEARTFMGSKIAPIEKRALGFDKRIVAPGKTARANLGRSRGNLHTVSVRFQDSAGVVWKRNWPNGVLRIEIRHPSAGSVAGGLFAVISLAGAASISYTMSHKGPTPIDVLEAIVLFVMGAFVGLLIVILSIFGNRESVLPPSSERRVPSEPDQTRTKLSVVAVTIVLVYVLRAIRSHKS
jgi:hypothetical protein